MQVHLKTLGCRLNEAELESWAEGFEAHGHDIVDTPDNADLLIVNTCAVTQEAVKKSRQIIRRAHRRNPAAKLVISGCYASLDKRIRQDINSIDLVVDNQHKDRLVDIALRELDVDTMPAISTEPGAAAIFKRGRHRAFIKIQDGCRYRCTFCIVTVARGAERSRTPAAIIDDINRIHAEGIQEVVLTGVHLGGYGSDIDNSLMQVIEQILAETDVPRIRLASLEPWDLPEGFFRLFENPRLMPHMHLPLQSGSNSVLRRMARRCKTDDFEQLVTQARREINGFNLTTDIIVGFPGETESEWRESIDFIERIGFSHVHIFTYSRRDGTRAATLPEAVASEVKRSRSRELHRLTRRMRQDYLVDRINETHQVLWESRNENGYQTGYTDNYIRVQLADSHDVDLEHRISTVILEGVAKDASLMYASLPD